MYDKKYQVEYIMPYHLVKYSNVTHQTIFKDLTQTLWKQVEVCTESQYRFTKEIFNMESGEIRFRLIMKQYKGSSNPYRANGQQTIDFEEKLTTHSNQVELSRKPYWERFGELHQEQL